MTGNASYVAGHGSQDITLVLATITFEFTAHSRTGIQEPANAAYGYLSKEQPGYTLGFAGIGFHWYPIPDSQDLRLHAVLASSNHFGLIDEYDGVATFDELSLSIGITYNLGLHRFWQK